MTSDWRDGGRPVLVWRKLYPHTLELGAVPGVGPE